MKKTLLIPAVGLVVGMLALAAPASAQMAESLRSQYHTAKELGAELITPADLNRLDGLMKDPAVKVLCLQLWPDSMNAARAQALLDWVRQGKTIWIYDARLGPWFGFEPCLLTKSQFSNKPESADLGGKGMEGAATVALAISGHELDTGVGQVSLFLPRLDDEHYGAILVKGDTVGLLQWKADSPAVAAMRREGKGAIFYKPLLWPDALSGDRFQANVLEWSAGYPIPGPAGEGSVGHPPGPKAQYVQGSPAVPLLQGGALSTSSAGNSTQAASGNNSTVAAVKVSGNDRVQTVGDGVLVGKVVDEIFLFETSSDSLKMARKEIQQITMGGGMGLDVLQTWDGHNHKGVLIMPSVEVDVNGDVRKILKKNLQKIQFESPQYKVQSLPKSDQ